MAKGPIAAMIIAGLLCAVSPHGGAAAASAVVPEKIENLPVTYLFPPHAETEVTLQSTTDVWIGWEAEFDAAQHELQNFGIEATDQHGGGSVATNFGSIKAIAHDGLVRIIMKNMEDFPMEVKIYIEEN